MKRTIVLALLVSLAALPACRERPTGLIVGDGTLFQRGGECGDTWLVHADDGRNYELTSLAAEFQEPDLRVHFSLKTRKDVVSTCMSGTTADVVTMKRL